MSKVFIIPDVHLKPWMFGFDFSIEKHQVVNEGTVKTKGQSITSPILEPDESKQIEEEDAIEDCVRDGSQRIEKSIGGKDAIQMVTFAAHVRRIMAENTSLRLISVLS